MPTHADFLRDIIAHRDDDGPRLIFADWLDEHGEGARAEFIRAQCELDPWRDFPTETTRPGEAWGKPDGRVIGSKDYMDLSRRAVLLLARHWHEWVPRYADLVDGWEAGPETGGFEVIFGPAGISGTFHRGFVADIVCTAAVWLAHADALRAATPLECVRLTTWPEAYVLGDGKRLLEQMWPTLAFELPPAVEDHEAALREGFRNAVNAVLDDDTLSYEDRGRRLIEIARAGAMLLDPPA